MANRKKKVIINSGYNSIIYDTNDREVTVYMKNNKLHFKSTSSIFHNRPFESCDCSEGVAALMRLESIFNDNIFWNLEIGDKYNISIEKTLYWLSGGDREWLSPNGIYLYDWHEVSSIFEHKFGDIIYDIVKNAKKLSDIRDGFMYSVNLPILYEFALSNNMV